MNYSEYLFSNLLGEFDTNYNSLPYGEKFSAYKPLYSEYVNSSFNRDDTDEYECMIDFLKNKYPTSFLQEDMDLLEDIFIDWWENGASGYWGYVKYNGSAEQALTDILLSNKSISVYERDTHEELGKITRDKLVKFKAIAEEQGLDIENADALIEDELMQHIILNELVYA